MATSVEWTPNEGIVRKFERLAFALVRIRPNSRNLPQPNSTKNIWAEKCRGLGGPFALGILIGIPYIAEKLNGSTLIASLLLAAIDASLAVWCYTGLECRHGHCTNDLFTCVFSSIGEFPAFLIGWWRIQGYSAGFAACCRSLSSIVDAVTGRHVEIFVDDQFGTFLPFGAKFDLLALLVAVVPSFMCAFGMEESGFLRFCLFLLTSSTTLAFFGSSLITSVGANETNGGSDVPIFSNIPPPDILECLPDGPEGTQYAKILTGAALASAGFFGLYKICCPDAPSVHYHHRTAHHRHFEIYKRFSLIGCLISTLAFLFYFLEATVLSKAPHTSRICRDPPLLWPLNGGWRIGIASLGISALALATFEFLIPLSASVTKLANDGLLYRLLKKDRHDLEETKWTLITPLAFGLISGLEALALDIKLLLSLVSSSLMCIHIVVSASMLATRYQVRLTPSSYQKISNCQTRTSSRHAQNRILESMNINPNGGTSGTNQNQTRRLMTISFLKSGILKIPQEMKQLDKLDLDTSRAGRSGGIDHNSDRTFLMDDVAIASIEPRNSTELSMGSGVSGYESDSDPTNEIEDQGHGHNGETDIDVAVNEYQENIRIAALNSGLPVSPTPASARRVSFSTIFLVSSSIALAASLNRTGKMDIIGLMLAISAGLLCFLLLVVISRQPQRKRQPKIPTVVVPAAFSSKNPMSQEITTGSMTVVASSRTSAVKTFFQYSIVPWGPAGAIFLHACLLVEALDLSGCVFAIWLATGLIIYFSYGVSKSIAAPIPNLISIVSPSILTNNERVRLCNNSPGTSRLDPNEPSSPISQSNSFEQQFGETVVISRTN